MGQAVQLLVLTGATQALNLGTRTKSLLIIDRLYTLVH